MEREGAAPSLHRLIGEAVIRGARLQEESRVAISDIEASTAALAETVATVHRCRAARRTFGNGPFDAEEGQPPG
jgi:hypothetical protein